MQLPQLKFIKHHPQINCPDCAIQMMPFSCRNVVVDRCENCRGLWFDKSELGIFRDSLKELPIEEVKVEMVSESDVHTISECPRCQSMLVESGYDYKTKVVLKKCMGCEGIWLPQGELMKFIELTKIAKIIEPDVKGAIHEWTKFHKEARNQKEFNQSMSELNRHRYHYSNYLSIIVPLYDENPRIEKPWITMSLIIIMVFIFFLAKAPFVGLGLVPGDLSASSFVTSMFLHGGVAHLLGNLYFLWTFGDNVEDVLGPIKYVFYFFICGFVASATHILFNSSSMIPAIGASGAISGLMGGYLYLFPGVNLKTWVNGSIVGIPVWIYLGIWFLGQLLSTALSWGQGYVRIAFGAHVGGFVAGYILIWGLTKLGLISRPRI